VDLEHQLSKTFADKFINDSLTIMVKDIAKECIEKEVEIKRYSDGLYVYHIWY
jgi:flagellar motor component MotA